MNAVWLAVTLSFLNPKLLTVLVIAGAVLFVALWVAAFTHAADRSRRVALPLAVALCGIVLALVFVALFGLSFVRLAPVSVAPAPQVGWAPVEAAAPQPPAPPATPAPDAMHVDQPSREVPAIDPWDPAAETALRPRVCSSVSSAAQTLVRESLIQLSPQLAETPKAARIVVDSELNAQHAALGTQLSALLRESLPLVTVQVTTSGGESEAASAESLVMHIDQPELESSAPSAAGISRVAGTLRLRASYGGQTCEEIKRYTEKPWVDRYAEFVSQQPQRSWLRVVGSTFTNDEPAANRDAVRAAVDALLPRVRTVLEANTQLNLVGEVPDHEIRQQLQAALERNELVADRFSQQLDGAFGTVWRAALLIDADPAQLTAVVQQAQTAAQTQQRHSLATGLAVLLMLGLVLVLYYVLNELTKGYFVWNLRAAAMVALLTIAVALCWWIA